jgi:hypothetical protein
MDKIDRNVLDALTDAGAIPAHPYTVIEVEAYPKESS